MVDHNVNRVALVHDLERWGRGHRLGEFPSLGGWVVTAEVFVVDFVVDFVGNSGP